MWDQRTGELTFKELPYYKSIVKSFLQKQIRLLLEQMSEEAGEESVVMTVNLEDGSMTHLGSKAGKAFLDDRDYLKTQFLSYCIASSFQNASACHESRQGQYTGKEKRNHRDGPDSIGEFIPAAKRRKKSPSTAIEQNMTPYDTTGDHVNDSFETKLSGYDSIHKKTKTSDLSSKDGSLWSTVNKIISNQSFNNDSSITNLGNSFSQNRTFLADRARHFEWTVNQDFANSNFSKQLSSAIMSTGFAKQQEGRETEMEKESIGCIDGTKIKMEHLSWDATMYKDRPITTDTCMYMSPDGVVSVSGTGRILRQPAKPRIVLTIAEKFKILEDLEANPQVSQRKLAERYNVGKTTIGHISRNRELYKAQLGTYGESQRKRFSYKNCKYNTINNLVWEWYSAARSNGLLVSGAMVQEKALQLAKKSSVSDFKASTGWLASWQSRYNIKSFRADYESRKNAKVFKDCTGKLSFDIEDKISEQSANDAEWNGQNEYEDRAKNHTNTGNVEQSAYYGERNGQNEYEHRAKNHTNTRNVEQSAYYGERNGQNEYKDRAKNHTNTGNVGQSANYGEWNGQNDYEDNAKNHTNTGNVEQSAYYGERNGQNEYKDRAKNHTNTGNVEQSANYGEWNGQNEYEGRAKNHTNTGNVEQSANYGMWNGQNEYEDNAKNHKNTGNVEQSANYGMWNGQNEYEDNAKNHTNTGNVEGENCNKVEERFDHDLFKQNEGGKTGAKVGESCDKSLFDQFIDC